MSLADAFAAALTKERKTKLVTGDPELRSIFGKLDPSPRKWRRRFISRTAVAYPQMAQMAQMKRHLEASKPDW